MSNYTKTTNFATKDALASGNPAKIVKGTEIDTEFNNIAVASGTKADKASPTFTGTVTLPVTNADSLSIGGDGVTVTGIKDEDDMASNSATKLASQQSIKAYVDAQVTAQDLDVTDGTTSISIDLDSEALSLLGGTGVTSTASGNGVTLAIDSTVATLTGTQTLTNKTLTTPVISGNLTTDGTIDGRDVATDGAKLDGIEALADVTDTVNVTAAGALMDSELTSIASVKALDQGVATTDSPSFVGLTASGEITANGGIALGDNDKATFGAGDDLQIFHNGTESFIREVGEGGLKIDTNGPDLTLRVNATETALVATSNGAVTAYYNNVAKLSTTATGIDVTGDVALGDNGKAIFGAGSDLQIYHDGSDSYVDDAGTGDLVLRGNNQVLIRDTGTNEVMGNFRSSGAVTLYYDNAEKISTTATGIDVTGTATMDGLTVNGDINGPATNNLAIRSKYSATIDIDSDNNQTDRNFQVIHDGSKLLLKAEESGDISFYEDTGTTAKFFWDASAESLGIGTDTPAAKLDSQEAFDTVVNILTNGTYAAKFGGDTSVGAAGRAQGIMISGRNGTARGVAILAENQNSGNAHDLLFATSSNASAPAERMRIDSSGNVGIGTSTPATQVELSSTASAVLRLSTSDTSVAENQEIGALEYYQADASGAGAGVKASIRAKSDNDTAAQTYLAFHTSSSSENDKEYMRIDSSGNVGIGTSAPTSPLTIKNSTDGNLIQLNGSNNAWDFMIKSTTPVTDGVTYSLGLYRDDGATNPNGVINFFRGGNEQTGFMSFDINGSEALRIDSSGNLLVGTTDNTVATKATGEGFYYNAGFNMGVARSAGTVAQFNRQTNDGDIIEFRKDGTSVGSIGTVSGDFNIFASASGHKGLRLGAGFIAPTSNSTSIEDATTDLGISTAKFRNLYLSGGVYLGGTGDANKLDDYEEGTWTPVLQGDISGSASLTIQAATYTKIGNTVHAYCYLSAIDLSADDIVGNMVIDGLPFNVATNNLQSVAVTYQTISSTYLNISGRITSGVVRLAQNSTNLSLARTDCSTVSGKAIMIGCTYQTTS